jgi:hypothetical protein
MKLLCCAILDAPCGLGAVLPRQKLSHRTLAWLILRRSAVTERNPDRINNEQRTAWEPPTIRKVAIGAETKSAAQGENNNAALTEPQPPSFPSTKFGFSFEMAIPMSARIDNKD